MIDIKEYVAIKKREMIERIGGREVGLCIIQLGNDNPASNSYVLGKIRDCEEVGIRCRHLMPPKEFPHRYLLGMIRDLSTLNDCHGIIVQLPLPPHIDVKEVQLAIDPSKDVDGFHPMSHFNSCTPMGVINYLKFNNYDFRSKDALVIGRSDIVGKPLAKLLTDLDCTVTLAHSKSYDILGKMKDKDIIFTAISDVEYYDESYYEAMKNAELVIDIGLGRGADNKLHGNLSKDLYERLRESGVNVVSGVGGVGLLTRLQLLENTLQAKGI